MSQYEVKCLEVGCGHDASEHHDNGCWHSQCDCPRTAASLYAAECVRLRNEKSNSLLLMAELMTILSHHVVEGGAVETLNRIIAERDAARAECERLTIDYVKAERDWAALQHYRTLADRYKAALEEIANGATVFAYHRARTALDADKENGNG